MPGTEFVGTALLEEVRGNYDRRIEQLTEDLNAILALTPEEKHTAWRAAAEKRIGDLCNAIARGTASDSDLWRFSISSPPYAGDDRHEIRRIEDAIKATEKARDKALAYVRSLAATDGVVTLYAADLKRIGYGL